MNIDYLQDFLLVSKHGGFSAANRASGKSKATLSRHIRELETDIGLRLIERDTASFALTNVGEMLVNKTETAIIDIIEAVVAIQEGEATPRGLLKISAPQLFSQVVIGELSARFIRQYPDVRIEVSTEDRLVDLIEEHFDVVIRVNPKADSELVGKCFARDRMILTAPPGFEIPANSGQPVTLPAVVFKNHKEGDVWKIKNQSLLIEPIPVIKQSSFFAVRDSVLNGAGIAVLPQSVAGQYLDTGELISWGIVGEEVELWVLYTSRRLQSPKVSAFVEFVSSQFPYGVFGKEYN